MSQQDTISPTLFDLLAREWTLGAGVSSMLFNASQTAVAFALDDGTVAIAAIDDEDPPKSRIHVSAEDGRPTIRPRSKAPAPLKVVLNGAVAFVNGDAPDSVMGRAGALHDGPIAEPGQAIVVVGRRGGHPQPDQAQTGQTQHEPGPQRRGLVLFQRIPAERGFLTHGLGPVSIFDNKRDAGRCETGVSLLQISVIVPEIRNKAIDVYLLVGIYTRKYYIDLAIISRCYYCDQRWYWCRRRL